MQLSREGCVSKDVIEDVIKVTRQKLDIELLRDTVHCCRHLGRQLNGCSGSLIKKNYA